MASVTLVVNSIPAEYKSGLDAEGRLHRLLIHSLWPFVRPKFIKGFVLYATNAALIDFFEDERSQH